MENEKQVKDFIANAEKTLKDLQEEVKGKADAEKVEGLAEEIQTKITEAFKIDDKGLVDYAKGLQEHFNTLEQQVTEIVQKAAEKAKDPEKALDEFLTSDEYKDMVKMYRKGERPNVKVLTVGSDLVAGTTSPVILPDREPGVEYLPRADTPIFNRVQKGTTGRDKVSWLERTIGAESHGTAMGAENTVFSGASDASWTEVEAAVKKLTAYFQATNEILEDTDFVRSEIMTMLSDEIPHLRETQLLSGTNSGNNMNGLLTAAKSFSLPTGFKTLADANEVDVLLAAMLQVELGYNATDAYTKGFIADTIVLHPTDAQNILRLRDGDGNLWFPNMLSPNGMSLQGAQIVKSTDITRGTYLVGQVNRAKYYVRRGIQIKFWDQYSTDPLYDRVLFTATERGCQKISNIAAYAFVTGTFDAGLTAVQGA